MQVSIVISPKELEERIISESKRIVKKIYGQNISGILYRIKTKQKPDNPRKVFIRGNGDVLEFDIHPHITLVQNLDLTDGQIIEIGEKIESISRVTNKFSLYSLRTGDYEQNFTIYIEFKLSEEINKLFKETLEITKPYMSEDMYAKYLKRIYVPHATIIYDDASENKIKEAKKILNTNIFDASINVKGIEMWKVISGKREIIKKFPLKRT